MSVLQRSFCFLYAAAIPYDIIVSVGPFSATVIAGGLLLIALAPRLLSSRAAAVRFSGMTLGIVYALVTWSLLTCAWAAAAEVAWLSWCGLAQNVVIAVALAAVLDEVRTVMLAGLAVATAFMSGTIVMTNTGEFFQRAQFMGADENITAYVLCSSLAACLILAHNARMRTRLILLSLGAVHALATILTASRTGLAAVLLLLATALYVYMSRTRRVSMKLGAIACSCLVVLLLLQAQGTALFPSRLQDYSSVSFAGDVDRARILQLYFVHFDSWWFAGVGQGSDAYYLQSVWGGFHSAHGFIWKAWIETGLVGLLLYLALVIRTVGLAAVSAGPHRWPVILLSIPMVTFAFSLGGASSSIFWFTVAFAWSAVNQRQRARGVGAIRSSAPARHVSSTALR